MTRSPLSSACTLLAMLLAGAGQAAAESFDCIIEPSAISTIVAAEKGVITDVPVARGDMVRKGDVLVRLQSDVEELQLELYRIQAETTVDVASAEKRLELRKTEYERARELENRQVGSRTHAEENRRDRGEGVAKAALPPGITGPARRTDTLPPLRMHAPFRATAVQVAPWLRARGRDRTWRRL